jgi:hypothetical protein
MQQSQLEIRGFKPVFTVIGAVYTLLASSMLVRGVGVLRDFEVPPELVSAPVLEDFFMFFYQAMALIGVLTVLFGHVTKGRSRQLLVAGIFCAANSLTALRDLATSDSPFGNRLYRGEATLVFVYIDVVLAVAFGALVVLGLRVSRSPSIK